MMQLARLLGQGILSGDGINRGFDHVTRWSGTDVWCLAFGYGLQLFFDFAGYSHIAIGAAQALGFTLPENFARPFQSTTPSIFWTRWHMSLSFWIRDYVFLPLAMLRREMWWRNLALVLSMILFGLWHKATCCSCYGAAITECFSCCIASSSKCSGSWTGLPQPSLDAALVAGHDFLDQPGMDFLSRQFPAPGDPDVVGSLFSLQLSLALSQRKSVPAWFLLWRRDMPRCCW